MERIPQQAPKEGRPRADPKQSKTSKTSPEGMLDSFDYALAVTIPWPANVGRFENPSKHARAKAIFDLLMARRAIDDWDTYSLSLAARLSRIQVSIEDAENTYLGDPVDMVVDTPQGGYKVNPMLNAVMLLGNQASKLMQALGLSTVDDDTMRSISEHTRSAKTAKKAMDKAKTSVKDEASLLA